MLRTSARRRLDVDESAHDALDDEKEAVRAAGALVDEAVEDALGDKSEAAWGTGARADAAVADHAERIVIARAMAEERLTVQSPC